MKKTISQLLQEAKTLQLTPHEKAASLHIIQTHMARYPRKQISFFAAINLVRSSAFAGLAIAVLAGAGVSQAAQKTLPGAILYPVKLLNETVAGLFISSTQEKSLWETERAHRRLTEIEQLAADNNAENDVWNIAEKNFNKTIVQAQKYIQDVEATGDQAIVAALYSHLESMLKAHETLLASLKLTVAVETMQSKIIDIASTRAKAEEKAVNAKERRGAEEKKDIRKKIEAVSKTIKAERPVIMEVPQTAPIIKAQENLDDAETAAAAGTVKLEADDYKEAFLLTQESERKVSEARILINAEKKKGARLQKILDQ